MDQKSTQIAQLALSCSDQLAELLLWAEPSSDAYQQVSQARFRYNMWANSNSAFSTNIDSLDCKLRKASLMKEGVIDLLEELESHLTGKVDTSADEYSCT